MLKYTKCSFLKKDLQHLGHLLSEPMVKQLPEKLDSIQYMPVSRNPKEVMMLLIH